MNWQTIRTHYPNQWVIMEALQAHTDGTHRVFEKLGVLDTCTDNDELFPRYKKLRAEFPQKEIIFFHSSRADLDIEVRAWHGILKPLRSPSKFAMACPSSQ